MKSQYQSAKRQGRFGFGRGAATLALALVAVGLCAGAFTRSADAQTTLLAGYDFQTTTNGGTAAAASPNSPLVYYSSFGTQTGPTGGAAIYLDGENGSSAFTTGTSSPQVTAFSGTAVNAGAGFSTVTASPASLAVANMSSNTNRIVFTLSTTGYQNLVLTYATQKTASGFVSNQFSYSTDGITFTNFGAAINPATAFATVTEDFSSITALNNAATVYIGYTISGATTTSGNNRLDNIQFNATPVPEPATVLGGALAVGAFGWSQRRRFSVLRRMGRA